MARYSTDEVPAIFQALTDCERSLMDILDKLAQAKSIDEWNKVLRGRYDELSMVGNNIHKIVQEGRK